jgi:Amt family ammonium transporter
VLAVGIFANGNSASAGWNGVQTAVTGLIHGGNTQIIAQVLELLSIFIVVGGLSYVFFRILNAFKLLRSAPADELMGLDVPEMGMVGYTNVDVVMPHGRLSTQIPARRTMSELKNGK